MIKRILKVTLPDTGQAWYYEGYTALSSYYDEKGIDMEYSDSDQTFYTPSDGYIYQIEELDMII